MFYHHEILTQRKYGVATVWLVATLGSKSTLTKRVSRKQISNVDVPNACDTIMTPAAPLALRLQSNLLYGLVLVHEAQVGYILKDAQAIQNNMRQLSRTVRTTQLDLEAGRTPRPDQLLAHDDPSFVPELALGNFNLDLSNLEMPTDPSSQSDSVLSPHSRLSSLSSDSRPPEILIPSSGGGAGDIGNFLLSGDDDAGFGHAHQGGLATGGDQDGFLPEADFTFDEAGNLHEFDLSGTAQAPISAYAPRSYASTDASATAQLQREQQHQPEVQRASANEHHAVHLDIREGRSQIEDYPALPEAEPFPERQHPEQRTSKGESDELRTSELESSESARAPIRRRRRARKLLRQDESTELPNRDVQAWQTHYAENMDRARGQKVQHKAFGQAKRNADYAIWGVGLGGIGERLGRLSISNDLSMFYGPGLFEIITGSRLDISGGKRSSEQRGDEDEAESQRKRQRSRSIDNAARAYGDPGVEDEGLSGMEVDDAELEIGRRAPTPGDAGDISSVMPWNRSAASSAARGSFISATQHQRGGSRTVSGSPLRGQGAVLSRHASRQPSLVFGSFAAGMSPSPGGPEDFGIPDIETAGYANIPRGQHNDEREMFGPAANVDTQTAAASQWIRKSLDQESSNFLDFVRSTVEDLEAAKGESAVVEAVDGGIAFDSLLPPTENTYVVASQGLLHVLTLGTRRLLEVKQEEDFGTIWMKPEVTAVVPTGED